MKKIPNKFIVASLLLGGIFSMSAGIFAQGVGEDISVKPLGEEAAANLSEIPRTTQSSPYVAEIQNISTKTTHDNQEFILSLDFDIKNTTKERLYNIAYTTSIVGDFRGSLNPTQEFFAQPPVEKFSLASGESRHFKLRIPLPKSLPVNDIAVKIRLFHEGEVEQWKMTRFDFVRGGGVFFVPSDFSATYKTLSPLQISGINPDDLFNIATLNITYASETPTQFPIRTYLKTTFYRQSDAQVMKSIQSNVGEITKKVPHVFRVDTKNLGIPAGEYRVVSEIFSASTHEKIGKDISRDFTYKTSPYQIRDLSLETEKISLFKKLPISFELVSPTANDQNPQTLVIELVNQKGKVIGSSEQLIAFNYKKNITTSIDIRGPFESVSLRIRVKQDSQILFEYQEKLTLKYHIDVMLILLLLLIFSGIGFGMYFLIKRGTTKKGATFIFFIISLISAAGFMAQVTKVQAAYRDDYVPNVYSHWSTYGSISQLVQNILASETSNPYPSYVSPYFSPTSLQQHVTVTDSGQITPVAANNIPKKRGFFDLIQPRIMMSPAVDCETGKEFSNNKVPRGKQFCIDVIYRDDAIAMNMQNTIVQSGVVKDMQYPSWYYNTQFDIVGDPMMRDTIQLRSGKGRNPTASTYSPYEWRRELRTIHQFRPLPTTSCPIGYNTLSDPSFGVYCSFSDDVNMPLTEDASGKQYAFRSLRFEKRFGPYQATTSSLGWQDKTVTITTTHTEELKEGLLGGATPIPSYSITAFENKLYYGIEVVCPVGSVQVGSICSAVCGTNANNYIGEVSAFPSDGTFCASGTLSGVSPSFPVSGTQSTWKCLGPNNSIMTDDVTCNASLCDEGLIWNGSGSEECTPFDRPVCGTAHNKVYDTLTTGYGTDSLCIRGVPSTVLFPTIGSRSDWNCFNTYSGGSFTGDYTISCNAKRCDYGEIVVGNKCVKKAQCGEVNGGTASSACDIKPVCGINISGGNPRISGTPLTDTISGYGHCLSGKRIDRIHTYDSKTGFPFPQFQQWSCVNDTSPLCAGGVLTSSCYNSGDAVDCFVPYYDTEQAALMSPAKWSPSNSCEGTIVSNSDGKVTVQWSANISISEPAVDHFGQEEGTSFPTYIWNESGVIQSTNSNEHTSVYDSGGVKTMYVSAIFSGSSVSGTTETCSVNITELPVVPSVMEKAGTCSDPKVWCAEGFLGSWNKDASGNYTWECRGYDDNSYDDDVTCSGDGDVNTDSATCTATFFCQDGQTWDVSSQSCVTDRCFNIADIQSTTPSGFNRDDITGNCCIEGTSWNPTTNSCSVNSCSNDANNPPTCTTCTAPQVWNSITNSCEEQCTNGANNPPTCTTCTAPQVWNSITNSCEEQCTNGANNPPTCTTCTAPQVWNSITNSCEEQCTNGANNPPTCTTCTAPQVWNSITNSCEEQCTNGANNPPTCDVFPTDQCDNIPGIQTSIPLGTSRNAFGDCLCVNANNNPPQCDTGVDMCINILNTQLTVPAGTVRNSDGTCTCINKASNPPTCILSCPLGERPNTPEFKIVYDVGQPLLFTKPNEVDGTLTTENGQILLSTNEVVNLDTWIPIFDNSDKPFYDPSVILNQPYLSVQRYGNMIKVLLYTHRSDNKIEQVSGQLIIQGNSTTKWESIKNISMDAIPSGTSITTNDPVEITSDPQKIRFKMSADVHEDAFVALFDVGGDICVPCGDGKVWDPDTRQCVFGESGVCGTRSRIYDWNVSDWAGGSNYCDLGVTTASPAFPAAGATVTWQCNNGGILSPICSAKRSEQPICGLYSNTFSSSLTDFPSGLATTYCARGTASLTPAFPATPGSSVSWTCSSPDGGTGPVANCTTLRGNTCGPIPAGQTACSGTPDPLVASQPYAAVTVCGTAPADACTFIPNCTAPQVWNDSLKKCDNAGACTSLPVAATECVSTPLLTIGNLETRIKVTTCSTPADTDTKKCEYTCPVGTNDTCVCENTIVPSEIRQNVGKPIIQCKDNTLGTHFRYRITGPSGSVDSVASYPVNTNIVHPSVFTTLGDYTVQCFYGTAAQPISSMTSGCTQPMKVTTSAQACEKISVYDATVSTIDPLIETKFASDKNLRFQCRSSASLGDTQKFGFNIGTSTPILLDILNPLPSINLLSVQTSDTLFTLGSTSVRCAVPTSDNSGYSTSDTCQASICIGPSCINPEPFILEPIQLSPEDNPYCTKETMTTYNIGCDGSKPALYNACVASLYALSGSGTVWTQPLNVKINDVSQTTIMTCTSQYPQDINNKGIAGCTITLNSGVKIEIETLPGKYQTMQGSVRDMANPDIKPLTYYTNYNFSNGTGTLQSAPGVGTWFKEDVTVVAECIEQIDGGQTDPNGYCACDRDAIYLEKSGYAGWTNQSNKPALPNASFYKTFTSSTSNTQQIAVYDEREHKSIERTVPIIRIDTEEPTIEATKDTTKITFTLKDSNSGIKLYGIEKGPSATCSILVPEEKEITKILALIDETTEVISYCIEDIAGNKIEGTYPFTGDNACFSDESSSVNLTNYKGIEENKYGLLDRVVGNKIGYILTDKDRMVQNQVFQTRLAGNINKYITSRYCQRTITQNDAIWEADPNFAAPVQSLLSGITGNTSCSSNSNPSGYFYYAGSGTDRILTLASKSSSLSKVSIDKPTVLYVTGADIYIREDIEYTSGSNASLVIIVQAKNGQGGKIYVDPSVTKIDGTLIADGAMMNGHIEEGQIKPIVWITDITGSRLLDKRLTVNGRLLTYNTRGGSLTVSGNTLSPLQGSGTSPAEFDIGKCIESKTGNIISCNWQDAAVQDLERFRFISDEQKGTNSQCTLYVTGDTTLRTPDILKTALGS